MKKAGRMHGGPPTPPRMQGKPPGSTGVGKKVKQSMPKTMRTHMASTKSPTQKQKL